ncbi:hypothetical protein MCOR27_001206 [Pyricularia oryzae]|uniref:Uncharacterized protein n=3 Tax=Pyricularia oryzae TaxID=318829 RepID=G4MTD8_PYRO7|nr:uncharacterized protein MGG_15727 [Pyricularia oryzae 70-15]ELQ45021.1 hypothetical protein OOU_Y34scaffold00022g9 [Pyricularia oryzae Y34]KAH9438751.1 hypothetical protein MCOR02_002354 [Pyricularia oryzae]EHA54689.1 hypothetical protein MGG_15727 [Pyricularia oryzae 70-15]KAI6287842.1 hypothetical protein MCOR27_001206 [Pyricularia oryzae]KAI6310869.1 hypothetical protein MCOR34_006208 [Pyricularia oryzae]
MPAIIGPARVLMGRLCVVLRTNQILKKICTHVQKNTRSNYCQGCIGPTIRGAVRPFASSNWLSLSGIGDRGTGYNLSTFCCPLFIRPASHLGQRRTILAGIRTGSSALLVCKTRSRFLQQQSIGGVLIWVGSWCDLQYPSTISVQTVGDTGCASPQLPQDVYLLTLSSNSQSRSFSEINPPGHLFQHP